MLALLACVGLCDAQAPTTLTDIRVRFTLPGNTIGVTNGILTLRQWIDWDDPQSGRTVWPDLVKTLDADGNTTIPFAIPDDLPGTLHLDASVIDANGNAMWTRSGAVRLSHHDLIAALLKGVKAAGPITIEADQAP